MCDLNRQTCMNKVTFKLSFENIAGSKIKEALLWNYKESSSNNINHKQFCKFVEVSQYVNSTFPLYKNFLTPGFNHVKLIMLVVTNVNSSLWFEKMTKRNAQRILIFISHLSLDPSLKLVTEEAKNFYLNAFIIWRIGTWITYTFLSDFSEFRFWVGLYLKNKRKKLVRTAPNMLSFISELQSISK
jgi:hypothetical protein